MKIEDKRMTMPLGDLESGDCFQCDGELFIRTNCDDCGVRIVLLENGHEYVWGKETMVVRTNAKVVLE